MRKIIFILLLLWSITSALAETPLIKKFITITDIHFNPFIGCDLFSVPCPILSELSIADPQSWDRIFQKYADKITTTYGQDTDYLLLTSTLNELKTLNTQKNPAFIILLGDFLPHHFPEQYKKYSGDPSTTNYALFTKKLFQYLTDKLNQAAPTTDIYPVLGNNDSYNGNYDVDPKGLFLNELTPIFSTLIKNKAARESFQNTFPNQGFYAVTLHQKNQRLVVLNSVVFSTRRSIQAKQQYADEQLSWLEKQLDAAKQEQQHVLLALHIPFGIDVNLGLKMHLNVIDPLLHPLFLQSHDNEKLLSLLQHYATTLVGILPAHIHRDALQLIADETHNTYIPSSFTPSISPIYGNNPGLKVFSYNDQTFELNDFDTYFYPLNEKNPEWKIEYHFNALYQPNCNPCSLVNGMLRLKKDNPLVDTYKKYYTVNHSTPEISITTTWIPYYWCGIYNMEVELYKACVMNKHS